MVSFESRRVAFGIYLMQDLAFGFDFVVIHGLGGGSNHLSFVFSGVDALAPR